MKSQTEIKPQCFLTPQTVLSSVLAGASASIVAPLNYAGIPPPYAGIPAPYAAGIPAPYAAGYPAVYNTAPVVAAPAPVVAAAPAIPTPVSSQFQAQDEFGNVNYGYSNINSAKQEVGNAYGGVTGSYQYIDANGIPQRVDYIADAAGFRVKATNLPVAPAVPETPALVGPEPVVYTGVAPEPVQDTPEVAAAKAEHLAALEEAKSRSTRSVPVAATYATGLPLAYNNLALNGYPWTGAYAGAYATPLAYSGALAAPLAYNTPLAAPLAYATPAAAAVVPSVPAARKATLTTIKLNPGHAVAYRVD